MLVFLDQVADRVADCHQFVVSLLQLGVLVILLLLVWFLRIRLSRRRWLWLRINRRERGICRCPSRHLRVLGSTLGHACDQCGSGIFAAPGWCFGRRGLRTRPATRIRHQTQLLLKARDVGLAREAGGHHLGERRFHLAAACLPRGGQRESQGIGAELLRHVGLEQALVQGRAGGIGVRRGGGQRHAHGQA